MFIGPPASAIEAMGSKTRARELMKAAGVPIVPGTTEAVATVADAMKIAKKEIGFPVAVKASGGGGGKGFRVALTEDELEGAFEGASREGEKFFSDGTVYLERYLPDPRHVEVQVLADTLRQRDPPRRARLLDPAPPPEGDRGVPGTRVGRRRGAARAHRQDRRGGGARRQLRRRGHDRGSARPQRGRQRRVLLPGDEHARAGRALRDRDDHGRGHRQGRHSRGGRRAAGRAPGGRCSARARDRVPHQRRGRLQELRTRAREDRRLLRAERPRRAGGLGRWRRRRSLARCTTRWWPS